MRGEEEIREMYDATRKRGGVKMATVLVKIAVAVDASGRWNASGWNAADSLNECSPDAMGMAVEGVDDGEARYYVTAVLRVPDAEGSTVEGIAESA